MRKFILSSLELFSKIAIFLILFFGLITGIVGFSSSSFGSLIGGAFGFFVALLICVILFGALFLLMEIAENTRRTAVATEALHKDGSREAPDGQE